MNCTKILELHFITFARVEKESWSWKRSGEAEDLVSSEHVCFKAKTGAVTPEPIHDLLFIEPKKISLFVELL